MKEPIKIESLQKEILEQQKQIDSLIFTKDLLEKNAKMQNVRTSNDVQSIRYLHSENRKKEDVINMLCKTITQLEKKAEYMESQLYYGNILLKKGDYN